MTITLTSDLEVRLAEAARQQGKTLEQVALDVLRIYAAQGSRVTTEESTEGSAADLFTGRIGLIQGSSEAFSQDCGKRFAEYVADKHRAGHL